MFIERCSEIAKSGGYQAMITQHSWMFLSSFEKLRERLLSFDIVNMAHLGARAFEEIGGEVVQTTAFVIRRNYIAGYKGEYCRLISPTTQQGKEDMFLAGENRFAAEQANFSKIPGCPVAYWVNQKAFAAFENVKISDYYTVRNGISTGNNEKYLRLWHEISSNTDYWKPCNKGGSCRKWYGNNEYFVYWKDNGHEIKTALDENGRIKARLGGVEFSFSKGIEMSRITTGELSFRISNGGFVYESSTNDIYQTSNAYSLPWLLGYCNSKVVTFFLNLMNPTINIMPEDLRKLPCIRADSDQITVMVNNNIESSKMDWDAYETSWDFKKSPLI